MDERDGVTEQTEPLVETDAAEAPAPEASAEVAPEPEAALTEVTVEEPEPEALAEPEPEPEALAEPEPVRHDEVSIWPFVGYVGVWLAYAGIVVWRFLSVPAETAVYESAEYPLAVFGGITLAFAGPLLALAVWIAAWDRKEASRLGLFTSAALKGSIATLVGVSLWWAALVVIDQVRLGRIL